MARSDQAQRSRASATLTTLSSDNGVKGHHILEAFARQHMPHSLNVALRSLYAQHYVAAVTGQSPYEEVAAGLVDWRRAFRHGPVTAEALALVDAHAPDAHLLPPVASLRLAFAIHSTVRLSLVAAMRAVARLMGDEFSDDLVMRKWEIQNMGLDVGGIVLGRLLDALSKSTGQAATGATAIAAFQRWQSGLRWRDVHLASAEKIERALAQLAIPDRELSSLVQVSKRMRREIAYWANERHTDARVQRLADVLMSRRVRSGRNLADIVARSGLTDDLKQLLRATVPPAPRKQRR